MPAERRRRDRFAAAAVLLIAAAWAGAAVAQRAGNESVSGDEAWLDAVLATPNYKTPVLPDNAIATAPGLEQPVPAPQFTLNALVPLVFNSNPEFRSSGGPQSFDASPVARLGWATQLGELPLRFSGAAGLEFERYPNAGDADIDYLRTSARLQYTPGDSQDFSPFFSYVPRQDFDPTLSNNFATRQDLNLGIDKVFAFDGNFNRIASGGSATPVWSLGFSAGVQRRFRDPPPQSYALFFVPSASCVISDQWNVSFSVPLTRRWFDQMDGFTQRNFTAEPVGVLEYIVPSAWLGGTDRAPLFGNPSVDLLVFHERNWSNLGAASYGQWVAGLVFKTGWRF
jgi:hypothetical protein